MLMSFRVWIDIENPPQVQYLLPLGNAFSSHGADVTITARDYGVTLELLHERRASFTCVGHHFGGSTTAKVVGNLRRVMHLRQLFREVERPTAVVSASRSAALTARSFGIPSFVICDYEHVNLAAFRMSGSFIVHPDVIPADRFIRRGVRSDRLIAFEGIKEDITFRGTPEKVPEHTFLELDGFSGSRVLLRPPAEESHYHRSESSSMADKLLARLAARSDVAVLYSPRYPWQADTLSGYSWKQPPVIVDRAVPFLRLYETVDAVISGGGTMTREAAYYGVPAITIFRGTLGGVDEFLQRIGRLTILDSPSALDNLDFSSLERKPRLMTNPRAAEHVVEEVTRRIKKRSALGID